jgi:FkbM family methyltransferase
MNHPLNKKNKLGSLLCFIKWQLKCRLYKSEHIYKWVDKTNFIIKRGEHAMTGNLYCGLLEYEDMSFVLHSLKETDNFYDIGANVGSYTLLASGVKRCKSFCFEPIQSTFERLINNVNLNKIQHLVDARNIGIGDRNERISFTNDLNTTNRVCKDSSIDNTENVDVIRLDDNFKPSIPSIAKIDVEGFEDFVLKGGKNFFSSSNTIALIIELNGSGKIFNIEDDEIHKEILSFGFSPIKYAPFERRLTSLESYNSNGNTIYVRDIEAIQKRCNESDSVCIHTSNDLII